MVIKIWDFLKTLKRTWIERDHATLEVITNRSQKGSQFVRVFGGIRIMLRHKVDFQAIEYDDFDDEEFDLDDY